MGCRMYIIVKNHGWRYTFASATVLGVLHALHLELERGFSKVHLGHGQVSLFLGLWPGPWPSVLFSLYSWEQLHAEQTFFPTGLIKVHFLQVQPASYRSLTTTVPFFRPFFVGSLEWLRRVKQKTKRSYKENVHIKSNKNSWILIVRVQSFGPIRNNDRFPGQSEGDVGTAWSLTHLTAIEIDKVGKGAPFAGPSWAIVVWLLKCLMLCLTSCNPLWLAFHTSQAILSTIYQ